MPWFARLRRPTIFYKRIRANATTARPGKTVQVVLCASARHRHTSLRRYGRLETTTGESNHDKRALAARLHAERRDGGDGDHRRAFGDRDERLRQLHDTQQGA